MPRSGETQENQVLDLWAFRKVHTHSDSQLSDLPLLYVSALQQKACGQITWVPRRAGQLFMAQPDMHRTTKQNPRPGVDRPHSGKYTHLNP